jgi:hypothetical protein
MTSNRLIEFFRVPEEFLKKFPDMSEEKANKYFNQYLKDIRDIFIKRLPFMNGKTTYVALNQLWGREFQYKNKRYYIYKEFGNLRPFFYSPEDKKGSNLKKGNNFEQNSEVTIVNQKLLDLLIDQGDTNELVTHFYGDIDDTTNLEMIPIDMNSLDNFIITSEQELKNDINQSHELTIRRNIRQAKYIKIISKFFYSINNQHMLPQIPNPSPYGRLYYKGINIQNISKEVRQAVLGEHYVYDLNAAVYAIKLMMVKDILKKNGVDHFGHFTYTKEYLDLKSQIRTKLSKHILRYPNPEKLVKEAITAIGFGARIGGGSWQIDGQWHTTSIEDIIMNPVDRHNFMNDPWITQFVREQQAITTMITDHFKEDTVFIDSLINIPNMFKNGRVRKSQLMSYLFQHTEKMIMDQITKSIPVVARVHDSFITKQKLSSEQITDIKVILSKCDPQMTIDCEELSAWSKPYDEDEEELIERKQLEKFKKEAYDRYLQYADNHNDGMCYDGTVRTIIATAKDLPF